MPDLTAPPKLEPQPSLEPVKLFNEFQSQSRARMEAAVKLVMILAGGMLTLSVGAVLGNAPSKIPASFVGELAWAWGLLFYSIAAATLVMAGMIVATYHMGVRWRKWMEQHPGSGTFFVATWTWLRVANAAFGVSALISFLVGTILISQVAIGVAHASGPKSSDVTTALAPAPVADSNRVPVAAGPKRDQPAEQPNLPTSTAIAAKQSIAADERAAKAELDRKLVDFNGDLAFYTLLLAIVAALQFVALVGQVVFLRLAFREARRGGDIARDAMIAGERAFVFALGVNFYWYLDGNTKQYTWRFRVQLRNSGDTPTRNTLMHTACVVRDSFLPKGFDFDYPTAQIGKALLAPHVDTSGGLAPPPSEHAVTPQDVLDVQEGRKFIFIMGWVKYSDVFEGTPRHLTRFCFQLNPLGDAFAYTPDKGGLTFPTSLHSEGNCIDDECDTHQSL